jgi:hypothetical protein
LYPHYQSFIVHPLIYHYYGESLSQLTLDDGRHGISFDFIEILSGLMSPVVGLQAQGHERLGIGYFIIDQTLGVIFC